MAEGSLNVPQPPVRSTLDIADAGPLDPLNIDLSPFTVNGQVNLVRDDGTGGTADPEVAKELLASGRYRLEAPQETEERRLEQEYSYSPFTAAGLGAASSVSMGLSDLIANELGYGEEVRNYEERNAAANFAGEVGGALLPAIPGVGGLLKYTPAGMAERAGARITNNLVKGGASKAFAMGTGLGVEGAMQGFGAGMGKLAIQEDPVTAEAAFAELGLSTLLGGGLGVGVGAGVGKLTSKIEARAAARAAAKEADPLGEMTADALGALRKEKLAGAEAQQAAAAVSVADGLEAHVQQGRAFLEAADDLKLGGKWISKEAENLEKALNRADALLSNKKALARNPDMARKVLEEVEQAALGIQSRRADWVKAAADEVDAASSGMAKSAAATAGPPPGGTLDMRAPGAAAGPGILTKDLGAPAAAMPGPPPITPPAGAGPFAGDYLGAGQNFMAKRAMAEELLNANKELLRKANLATSPVDEIAANELKVIDDVLAKKKVKEPSSWFAEAAKDAAGYGLGYEVMGGLMGGLMGGGVPFAFALVAARRISAAVESALTKVMSGKSVGDFAGRLATGMDNFMKGGGVGRVIARPAAAAVLSKGDESHRKRDTPEVAQQRINQLLQMAAKPDTFAQKVHDGLAPLRAVQPGLADKVEMQANAAMQYVASKVVPSPDIGDEQTGFTSARVSKSEARKLAKIMDIIERPVDALLEDLNDGTLTPDAVEAMKAVYPATYEAMREHVAMRIPELRRLMPYKVQLRLGMLLDLDVNSVQRGEFLVSVQKSYAAEEQAQQQTAAPARSSDVPPEPMTTGQRISGAESE